MAITNYDYSISQDFPNGKVDTARLTEEVRSSSIVTALNRVDTEGDSCSIWFNDELSVDDKSTLDSIVAAHSGLALKGGASLVQIDETNGLSPDMALSCTEDVAVPVLAGQSVSVGYFEMPFLVDIIAAQYYVYAEDWNKGDHIHVDGIPAGDPAIGVAGQTAAADQNEMYVSPTILAYSRAGMSLQFDGDESEDPYRIASIDSVESKVTFVRNLENEIVAGTPARLRRVFIPYLRVLKEVLDMLGGMNAGSSKLEVGEKLRIHYHHVVAPIADSTMYVRFIYMY